MPSKGGGTTNVTIIEGTGVDLTNIPEYSALMVGKGGVLAPLGLSRLDEGKGNIEADATIIVPQQSLQLGYAGVLTAFGALPSFRSFVSGRRGTFPITYWSPETGSERTVEVSGEGLITVNNGVNASEEMPSGGSFVASSPQGTIISKIRVRQPVGASLSGLRAKFTVRGQSEPFYYYPSKVAFDGGVGEDFENTGENPNNVEIDLVNSPILLVSAGDGGGLLVDVEYEFDSGSLLGDGATPFFEVDENYVTLRELAYKEEVDNLKERLDAISTAFGNSGRSFVTVPGNASFVIGLDNAELYNDKILINAPRNDKVVDVDLPTNEIIEAKTGYPYILEPHQVGGTSVGEGTNLLRFRRFGEDPTLSASYPAILGKDETAILIKFNAEDDWVVSKSIFDPNAVISSVGTFVLQDETVDASDLKALTNVLKGYAYSVEVGNDEVSEGSVIVALVNTPDDDVASEDWLVLDDITEAGLLLAHMVRSGNRFDADKHFFINESNVVVETNVGAGGVQRLVVLTPNSPTEQTHVLGTAPITLDSLVGGSLTLEYSLAGTSSGFDPEFRDIVLDYGDGIVFTFDIRGRSTNGLETVEMQIPNVDYSKVFGKSCTVSLRYFERGVQFAGNLNIFSLTNVNVGTLYSPIVSMIDGKVALLERSTRAEFEQNETAIESIKSRLISVEALKVNPMLNLSPNVVSLISGNLAVEDQEEVERQPSPLNLTLGGGVVPGLVLQGDDVVNAAPTERVGKKVFYLPQPLADGDLLQANSAGLVTSLVARVGDELVAKQFVPAIPQGSREVVHYPTPVNRVGGEGTWFLMQIETGHTTPVAVSESFVLDVPTTETTVTFEAQILANGEEYSHTTKALQAGGSVDTSINFVETQGQESVSIEVSWVASTRVIRVRATPHVGTNALAIDDLQVRMEWSENVVVPGASETVRNVNIGNATESFAIVGIKVVGDSVVVVTRELELVTGYSADAILGVDRSGRFVSSNAMTFDANYSLNASNIGTLYANRDGVFFGLFINVYNHNTILELAAQLSVLNNAGAVVNTGDSITTLTEGLAALALRVATLEGN